MAINYPSGPIEVRWEFPAINPFLMIGQLVRAFAEIEDIISLYLYKLANVSESCGCVMLGRTPISVRISQLAYLASLHGDEAVQLHKARFTPEFFDALKCRNVVAHGVLLGRANIGERDLGWAFMTNENAEPNTPLLTAGVTICFTTESITHHTVYAVKQVDELAIALGVQELRLGRRGMPLNNHPKSRSTPQAVRQPPQPESSQALARQAKLARKEAQRADPKNRKKTRS